MRNTLGSAGRGEPFIGPHRFARDSASLRCASPKDYFGDPTRELSIHGVEKTDETGRLCRLNLAVHGVGLGESLSGDAQVFNEHGKRFVVSTVGAVASGDAQWFRAGR